MFHDTQPGAGSDRPPAASGRTAIALEFMQTISTRIAESEKLTRLLGAWPSFHDAEIVSVELNRGAKAAAAEASAIFQIRLFEKDTDLFVRLLFTRVEDLKLEDFNHQNVIYEMRIIDASDGKRARVEVDTSFGLSGGFTCERVEVLSVSTLPKE
jgi:hypothetical protein